MFFNKGGRPNCTKMAYKKYIKRGGKVYGPYVYHSRKVNGKVISEYLGKLSKGKKKEDKKKKKKRNKYLKFILAGIFIFLSILFLTYSLIKNPAGFSTYENLENKPLPEQEQEQEDLASIRFVIELTNGQHLDSNRQFIFDIYNEIKSLDNAWSETVPENHYVRVTFEEPLSSKNDIKIYPRVVSGNPKIEVYEKDGDEIIATFDSLTSDEYNKVSLTNLQGSQDTFDLKVLDGSVEINHVIDPVNMPINDTFQTTPCCDNFTLTDYPPGTSACDWYRNQEGDGTVSSSTGPEADHTIGAVTSGGRFAFVETSSGYCGTAGNTAYLESPEFTAGTLNTTLTFWYHMYGSNIGDLSVEVYDTSWHDTGWIKSGQQQTAQADPYLEATIDLSSYSGVIKIRFKYVAAGSYRGDAAIDDVVVTTENAAGDTEYPQFSSLTETPSDPATYASGQNYQFNATITSTNGTAGIEFNGVNHTATNSSSAFSVTVPNLAANTGYNYYWWAFGNGTSHNFNLTTTQTYTINKAVPQGSVSGTSLITYGTAGNVQGTESNSGDGDVQYKLYRDGVEVSNPDDSILGVGAYNYVYNATSGTNYTANASIGTFSLTVNQASSQTSLTFDKASPQDYGTEITPTCSIITGQGSAILKMDGDTITSGNPLTLGADTYTFNCSLAESQNYTYSENVSDFTIDKAVPIGSLDSSAGWTITYPTETTISLSESNSGDGGVTYKIYRDGADKGTGETITFGYGTYDYILNTTGGANYTSNASMDAQTLTVNKNAGACDILFNETSPITYPATFKVYSNCNSDFTLYRNGTTITNNTEQVLSAGTWNFTVQRTDTQNYTNIYDEELFTINQATGQVNGFINNTQGNFTAEGGTANKNIYLNATINSPCIGTGSIVVNGTTYNTGTLPLYNITNLSIGFYNATFNYDGNTNCSSDTEVWWINITAPPDYPPTISVVYPQNTTYNIDVTQLNYTAEDDNSLSHCWYSLNRGATNSTPDATCSNFTGLSSSEGSNNWTVYANDSINQMSSDIVFFTKDTIYPQFSNYQRTPDPPNEDQNVQINVTVTESNLDKVILEFNNGTAINYTVTTNNGNEYYFTVLQGNYTAHDSVTYYWYANDSAGNMNKSSQQSFTVANQIPSVSTPAINDTTPETNDLISCNGGTFSDNDAEDTEQTRYFEWYDTDVKISEQTSQTLDLSVSGLDKGDVIKCSIRVYDGYDNSSWTNSSNTATIQNSPPSITNPLTTVSWNANGSTYNYDYEATDLDTGDSFIWYDNTTLFNINSGTGLISDTPTESEAGNYPIRISVSDGTVNATDDFTYTINDVTPPNINFQSPTEENDSQLTRNYIQVNVTASDGKAIDKITLKLYNSTSLVQTNTSSTSPLFVNFTNLPDEFYYFNATVNDTSGNVNQTETRVVSTDTGAPTINYVPSTENSGVYKSRNYIEVNVTAGDPNLDKIVIRLYNSVHTQIDSKSSSTSPNFANFTSLSDGLYFYNATANDTFGNDNSLETRNITLDTLKPSITTLVESPTDPTSYSQEATHQFNATITDTNLDKVLIEFNGVNYTPTKTGNVYNLTLNDLAADTYDYYWYANDSAGNVNTSIQTYAVNQNSEACNILFNETSPINYGTLFKVFSDCTSDFVLKRNGTTILNNSVQNLAAGTWNFTVQRTDTQNYTNIYDEELFTINKATGDLTFLINGSAQNQTGTYGIQTNASASTLYGTITLYRNQTDVTSKNNVYVTLAANYYNYTAASSGDQNHTSVSSTLFVDISKASSGINLTLNGTDDNVTITQDSSIWLNVTTITGDSGATLKLYKNGTLINQGPSPLANLTAFNVMGLFNITGIYAESENFTGSYKTWWVNVTEAPDLTNPSVSDLTEFPIDPANYSPIQIYQFNATITDNRQLDVVLIEFDGVNYTPTNLVGDIYNFTISDLTVGTYNYRWYANDTSENMNSTESGTYTINKATPSLGLTITPSTSETYGTQTTANGTGCPSQLTCNLYRNGIVIGNSETITLAAGTYNYTYNTTGNTNYTSASVSDNLTINKATGVVYTYLDNSRSNITIEQETVIYLNGTLETGTGNIKLYNNGTLINQGASPLSNLTNLTTIYLYNITTIYEGNQNYTSAYETFWVNVIELDITPPQISITYPQNTTYNSIQTQLNYTASDNFGLVSCWYSLNNGITNTTIECNENKTGLNSEQGNSTWTVWANDAKENLNSSSVTFFVDSITPTIQFISPTETSGNTFGRNYIRINVTANDTNLDTIIIRLYNSTSLVQTNISPTSPFFINYTGLTAGTYFFNATVNDSVNNQNSTQTRNISLIPPTLTIHKPKNETYITKENLPLKYSANYEDYVWYNIDLSGDNIPVTGKTIFNVSSEGSHTLYLYANNSNGETVKNVTFTINPNKFRVVHNKYEGEKKGNSTDFNALSYEELQNLSGVILENTDNGKIMFDEPINLTDDANVTDNEVDLSNYTNISENHIEINTTALPNFNKSATLYLYNLTFSNPRILRDGSICPETICTQESYSGGILRFNVTQFTVYSAEEGPVEEVPGAVPGAGVAKTPVQCLSNADCEGDEICWNYLCVRLFDIKIIDFESPAKLGDFFDFTYLIKGMANVNDDVEVRFWIENQAGERVTSGSDTIYLGSFEEKTETTKIFLPTNIKSGIYQFYVEVAHQAYQAKSYRTIEIQVKEGIAIIGPIDTQKIKTYIIVFALILFALILFLIIRLERKRIKKLFLEGEKFTKKHKTSLLVILLFITAGLLAYSFNLFTLFVQLISKIILWSKINILPYGQEILRGILILILLIILIIAAKKNKWFESLNEIIEKRKINRFLARKYRAGVKKAEIRVGEISKAEEKYIKEVNLPGQIDSIRKFVKKSGISFTLLIRNWIKVIIKTAKNLFVSKEEIKRRKETRRKNKIRRRKERKKRKEELRKKRIERKEERRKNKAKRRAKAKRKKQELRELRKKLRKKKGRREKRSKKRKEEIKLKISRIIEKVKTKLKFGAEKLKKNVKSFVRFIKKYRKEKSHDIKHKIKLMQKSYRTKKRKAVKKRKIKKKHKPKLERKKSLSKNVKNAIKKIKEFCNNILKNLAKRLKRKPKKKIIREFPEEKFEKGQLEFQKGVKTAENYLKKEEKRTEELFRKVKGNLFKRFLENIGKRIRELSNKVKERKKLREKRRKEELMADFFREQQRKRASEKISEEELRKRRKILVKEKYSLQDLINDIKVIYLRFIYWVKSIIMAVLKKKEKREKTGGDSEETDEEALNEMFEEKSGE